MYIITSATDIRLHKAVISFTNHPTRRSTTQEFTNILWKSKVNYRIHKNPPSVPIPNPIYPVHTISLRYILILSSHLRLGLPSSLFHSDFPIKILYSVLPSHTWHMPCPSHPACPCHHATVRPQVAGGGDDIQIRRVAANILISSRGQPTRGDLPAWWLGVRLTTHSKNNNFVTKYYTALDLADYLDKRPKLMKVYVRFGI
jgi:hypothetical protein